MRQRNIKELQDHGSIMPSLEEIFAAGVQASVESAKMLNLTETQFVQLLAIAWKEHDKNAAKEAKKQQRAKTQG